MLDALGLMKLVERAVNEPDMSYTQRREELQLESPGKVKFTSTSSKSPGGNENEKGSIWTCTVQIEGKDLATVESCTCEDEAEERAATEALRVLQSRHGHTASKDIRTVSSGTGDRKRKRLSSLNGQESDKDDSDSTDSEDQFMIS